MRLKAVGFGSGAKVYQTHTLENDVCGEHNLTWTRTITRSLGSASCAASSRLKRGLIERDAAEHDTEHVTTSVFTVNEIFGQAPRHVKTSDTSPTPGAIS